MVVPLRARGETFGAITFVSAESERRFDEDDLTFATELARRAALSIDNARLYADLEDGAASSSSWRARAPSSTRRWISKARSSGSPT